MDPCLADLQAIIAAGHIPHLTCQVKQGPGAHGESPRDAASLEITDSSIFELYISAEAVKGTDILLSFRIIGPVDSAHPNFPDFHLLMSELHNSEYMLLLRRMQPGSTLVQYGTAKLMNWTRDRAILQRILENTLIELRQFHISYHKDIAAWVRELDDASGKA
jgi:hypothetical protein